MNTVNIILCGIGGQGLFKVAELLGQAALRDGFDVRMTRTQAIDPEGGSVSCQLRFGSNVLSGIVHEGEADFILSLERTETLRHLHKGKDGVTVLVNDETVEPPTGESAEISSPEKIEEVVKGRNGLFYLFSGAEISGGKSLAPVTLLGALAAFNLFSREAWDQAIDEWAVEDAAQYHHAFQQGIDFITTPLHIEAPRRAERHPETESIGVRTFNEMLKLVQTLPKRRVAIAGGENLAALHAGIECVELGLGTPVFIGTAEKIKTLSREHFPDFDIDSVEIIEAHDDLSIAETSVAVVRNGEADILLKGGVNTPTLMRAALSGKTGLRAGTLLSDTFVFEYPDEDGIRLVMITDGGVNLLPTIQQKIEILKNAVVVAHALGNTNPRVALLAASEDVNPNLPLSMDAAVITAMNRSGQISDCTIEGPMALDVAVSKKAAAIKGTASDVAGRADILVAASIDTANALAKSTTYFAGYRLSHVIVGGTAPILIASRSDTSDAKLLSVALGSLMAKYFEEQRAK